MVSRTLVQDLSASCGVTALTASEDLCTNVVARSIGWNVVACELWMRRLVLTPHYAGCRSMQEILQFCASHGLLDALLRVLVVSVGCGAELSTSNQQLWQLAKMYQLNQMSCGGYIHNFPGRVIARGVPGALLRATANDKRIRSGLMHAMHS